MKRVFILIFLVAFSANAELWVNAVRDPGAELGQDDWETEIWEHPDTPGSSDSARVDCHDSTRAFEGSFSFLTDTKKDPQIPSSSRCYVSCKQSLKIPKAVADIDSCFWVVDVEKELVFSMADFHILFRSQDGKNLRWVSGRPNLTPNDTLYSIEFTVPDSGVWTGYGDNFSYQWTSAPGWSLQDIIMEVKLSSGGGWAEGWFGQEVYWDNIVLRSLAYYDYAAESIDSDELADKTYTPTATFANEGKKDDKDGWVYAEILEGTTLLYKDSLTASIPSETSEQFTFSQWTIPHDGMYTLRAYPILDLDEYSPDDTLEQTLTGVGIAEPATPATPATPVTPVTQPSSLHLEVTSLSSIHYSLPSGEHGTITLYDPSGRRVESLTVRGTGQANLRSGLASGVYFVKLDAKHSILIKKMVLVR